MPKVLPCDSPKARLGLSDYSQIFCVQSPGEYIFRKGDADDSVCFIMEGDVELIGAEEQEPIAAFLRRRLSIPQIIHRDNNVHRQVAAVFIIAAWMNSCMS